MSDLYKTIYDDENLSYKKEVWQGAKPVGKEARRFIEEMLAKGYRPSEVAHMLCMYIDGVSIMISARERSKRRKSKGDDCRQGK